MKAYASLFTLLLAAIQPVLAQTVDAKAAQREDEYDGRRMQLDYRQAYAYANKVPAYSAEEVTETKRALADGNQINNSQTSMRYGDHNGRVRASYKAYNGSERIFIADPNAKVAYLIRPNRKDILRISGEPAPYRLSPDFPVQTRAPDWSKEVKTSLGVKEFAGVKAVGSLTETFYPAGVRGNEKEMVETRETWRSNELHGYVYSRSFSPREGERIVRLENIKFGDVPESLFTVPTDYAIRDIVLDTTQAMQ